MRKQQKWLLLEADAGWQIVFPSPDTKCHGFPKDDDQDVEMAGIDCPCKPKIDYLNKMIVHNSFRDLDKIEDSLNKILNK